MATLNPVLRDFWRKKARYRILYGGRASSKSWDACGFILFLAQHCTVRVCACRQFQNKITESVYTLLVNRIEAFGLSDQFTILNNSIVCNSTGSEFVFYGLWRNIDEIKSLEGIDILWIEEAHNLTEEQWKILEPTIRKEGSQIWIIFNPRFASDFVYQRFVINPPPNSVVRKINYDENPFLSRTMLDVIEAAQAEDFDEFQHVYLGVPRDSDDSVIIKRRWIEAAVDAHLRVTPAKGVWSGVSTLGYDVADSGQDANASVVLGGSVCVALDEWKGGEDKLLESVGRVLGTARAHGVRSIGYDSIGVGAFVGSHLNAQKWTSHYKFNAGAAVSDPDKKYGNTQVTNKEKFKNLKAQAWTSVADRFRNTYLAVTEGRGYDADQMISLDSTCDSALLTKLIDELSTPMRDYDTAGRDMVEGKKDLAKRDVKSPNLADAFIIAASRGLIAGRNVSEWI